MSVLSTFEDVNNCTPWKHWHSPHTPPPLQFIIHIDSQEQFSIYSLQMYGKNFKYYSELDASLIFAHLTICVHIACDVKRWDLLVVVVVVHVVLVVVPVIIDAGCITVVVVVVNWLGRSAFRLYSPMTRTPVNNELKPVIERNIRL